MDDRTQKTLKLINEEGRGQDQQRPCEVSTAERSNVELRGAGSSESIRQSSWAPRASVFPSPATRPSGSCPSCSRSAGCGADISASEPSSVRSTAGRSAFTTSRPESAVEVLSVTHGGPAALGGLRKGDLIVSMNGTDMTSVDVLQKFLSEWPIGKPVKVTLLRGPERLNIEVTPSEAEIKEQVMQKR